MKIIARSITCSVSINGGKKYLEHTKTHSPVLSHLFASMLNTKYYAQHFGGDGIYGREQDIVQDTVKLILLAYWLEPHTPEKWVLDE